MTKTAPLATLLIVDDYPDNITVMFDYLTEAGYHVLGCESGAAALETMSIEEPDLILLDVMMPGMNGLETCRRIKETPAGRDVPIFFMTALGESVDKVRGLEAGAIDYLTKPVYPEEVLKRVHAHLEIRQLQKSLQEQNDLLDAALQRSILAEKSLENSYERALLVVRLPGFDIAYSTPQAKALITRLGGEPSIISWLKSGEPTRQTTDGVTVTLQQRDNSPEEETLLFTLTEQAPPSTPDDLKSLGLTPRETQILYWVAQGKTNPEVAIILEMQTCTVKKHVENLLPKLGVETRLAAALRAHEVLSTRQ